MNDPRFLPNDRELQLSCWCQVLALDGVSDIAMQVMTECLQEAGDLPWWQFRRRARLLAITEAMYRVSEIAHHEAKRQDEART